MTRKREIDFFFSCNLQQISSYIFSHKNNQKGKNYQLWEECVKRNELQCQCFLSLSLPPFLPCAPFSFKSSNKQRILMFQWLHSLRCRKFHISVFISPHETLIWCFPKQWESVSIQITWISDPQCLIWIFQGLNQGRVTTLAACWGALDTNEEKNKSENLSQRNTSDFFCCCCVGLCVTT